MQKEISNETGMSRSQVSRYERGRDTPNLVTLVKYLATIGSDFRDLHNAIQEVKAQDGFTDPGKPFGAAEFERSMANRLPLAPELRNALYELLEPVFHEIEDIKKTLAVLQEAVTPNDLKAEEGGTERDTEAERKAETEEMAEAETRTEAETEEMTEAETRTENEVEAEAEVTAEKERIRRGWFR